MITARRTVTRSGPSTYSESIKIRVQKSSFTEECVGSFDLCVARRKRHEADNPPRRSVGQGLCRRDAQPVFRGWRTDGPTRRSHSARARTLGSQQGDLLLRPSSSTAPGTRPPDSHRTLTGSSLCCTRRSTSTISPRRSGYSALLPRMPIWHGSNGLSVTAIRTLPTVHR